MRTAQYTLVLDRLRRCFCRLPSGADLDDPSLPMSWLPYHSVWRDPRTGSLTLTLDAAGTRRAHDPAALTNPAGTMGWSCLTSLPRPLRRQGPDMTSRRSSPG